MQMYITEQKDTESHSRTSREPRLMARLVATRHLTAVGSSAPSPAVAVAEQPMNRYLRRNHALIQHQQRQQREQSKLDRHRLMPKKVVMPKNNTFALLYESDAILILVDGDV